MSERLVNKTAVITGGASGLGFAIAKRFIEEGAQVIITDINIALGKQSAEMIGACFMSQDVTDEAQWHTLFSTLRAQDRLPNILVNNAGFADAGLGELFEDIDLIQAKRIFEVNVAGTLLGCKHTIRNLKTSGCSIINMSSIGGLVPVPFIAAYGASKAAVLHLSRSVALYCAQQRYPIRCNCILPGQIQTPMHNRLVAATAAQHAISIDAAEAQFRSLIPQGEFGLPEDVANAALYLASDESKHVTGDRMLVDGGMLLSN